MLKSISWGQYLQMLLMVLPVYYLIILTLFFRKDLQHLLLALTRKKTKNKATSPDVGPAANKTPNESSHPHHHYQQQHHHQQQQPPANALLSNPPITYNAIKLKQGLKSHLITQSNGASVQKEPKS